MVLCPQTAKLQDLSSTSQWGDAKRTLQANAGGYWQPINVRKQKILKELAMKAWGGQVWEMLKAEAVTEILACKQPLKIY